MVTTTDFSVLRTGREPRSESLAAFDIGYCFSL